MIKAENLSFELPTNKGGIIIPKNSPKNYEVEADFYKGSEKIVVVIIVGKGGTIQGYQNKYVTIANNLVKNHGVNVFVIGNPGISRDNPELFFDCAMKFVKKKIKDYWFRRHIIYAVGFSAGGHFVGRFAYKYPNIEQILLINPVLRVDFEKLKDGLDLFKGKLTIVQGDKDDDYSVKTIKSDRRFDCSFYPLLDQIPNAHIDILKGVDHQFTNKGGLETFIELPEKYLFGYIPVKCHWCGEEYNWNDDRCKNCGWNIHQRLLPDEADFPWEDIKECINDYARKTDKKCPICGENMLNIHFKSPARTWKHLCGREGTMDVCTNCRKGFNFKCHVMN